MSLGVEHSSMRANNEQQAPGTPRSGNMHCHDTATMKKTKRIEWKMFESETICANAMMLMECDRRAVARVRAVRAQTERTIDRPDQRLQNDSKPDISFEILTLFAENQTKSKLKV